MSEKCSDCSRFVPDDSDVGKAVSAVLTSVMSNISGREVRVVFGHRHCQSPPKPGSDISDCRQPPGEFQPRQSG